MLKCIIFLLLFISHSCSFIIPNFKYNFGFYTPHLQSLTKLQTHDLNDKILTNLKNSNIESLNDIQNESIPKILQDSVKNICILSQTGTGKTLSYLIPIDGGKDSNAVILVPNSILMYQVYEVLDNLTRDLPIKVKTVDNVETGKLPHIIISSPLKLINKFKAYSLNYKVDPFENVKYLVLDELDQLFIHKEVLLQILKRSKNRIKTILSSSTLPNSGTKSDSKFLSTLFQNCVYVKSENLHKIPEKISIDFIKYQDNQDRLDKLINYLSNNNHRMIIYCNKSSTCQDLSDKLSKMGKVVHLLNKNVNSMEQVLIATSDKKMIIISTDLSSRGVDFKDIHSVIHYDFPTNVVSFIHRTGRVGRNGSEGNCMAFWSDSDEFLKDKIEQHLQCLSNVFSRRRGLRKRLKKEIKRQNIM